MESLAGRKPDKVQQTFVLYDEDIRPVKPLVGFGRIYSVMCDHLPLVQPDDTIEFRVATTALAGRARVLDYKHAETGEGRRTLLAVMRLTEDDESEAQEEYSG